MKVKVFKKDEKVFWAFTDINVTDCGTSSGHITDTKENTITRKKLYKVEGENGDRGEMDYKDISINLIPDPDSDEEVVMIEPPDK